MHHSPGQHLEAIAGKLGGGRGAVDHPLRRLRNASDDRVVIAMWKANCSHHQTKTPCLKHRQAATVVDAVPDASHVTGVHIPGPTNARHQLRDRTEAALPAER